MRFTIISILLVVGIVGSAQTRPVKISDYYFNSNFDFAARQLLIDVRITFQKKDSSGTIPLLLSHHSTLKNVRSSDRELIAFSRGGDDTVTIRLPEKLKKSKKFTLLFTYVLSVDSFKVEKGMFVMKRSDRWYPVLIGDLFNSTIRITVPDNLITVSNGECIEKTWSDKMISYVWKTIRENNLVLFIFNPDSMEYKSEDVTGTRINFYFVPGLKDEKSIISEVKSSFKFYCEFMGKYKNDNFTVIEIPADWFLGQGLHTLLIFTSKLLEYIPDPGNWVPHEVGHQWIGNMIPVDETAKGYWFIEESLNEYMKAMYVEHEYGSDSLKTMMNDFYLANYNANVEKGKDVSIMDVVSVNNSVEEAQSIYAKGPMVLHQLRRCMGDAHWKAMIKRIYKTFQTRQFTLENFKVYISKYDRKGQCLKIFDTFLITKGIPEILKLE